LCRLVRKNHQFLFLSAFLMRPYSFFLPCYLGAATLLLTACDSTPRERQAAVKDELRELDTVARAGGKKLARLGKATAAYNAANRARRAQPLDPRQEIVMENNLLGPYSGKLAELTPATIADAYASLVRETRTRRATWTDRDWDYAHAVYKRLNEQLKLVRLDLPARDELRIRTRQAEFVALQAGHTAKGLEAATRQPAARQ
jgi:hypothetical protein